MRATRAQMLFGRALAASGDIPRARHVIFHAIRAMRHTISDSAPFTGHGYMEFANVALLNGEDWLAKLALTKAQILLERYHEPDHAGRIRYHLVSAKVHRRWAQRWLDEESMKTAEKHAKMAAGMLEQQLGKDNAALSPYYLELALIYREQYNVKEALKYGVDALKLTNATFGGVHPRNLDSLDNHLELLVAGNLPDVSMQGLNRQAPLVDKGIAQSLEPFIAAEADFEKEGYHEAMLALFRAHGCKPYLHLSVWKYRK